MQSRGKANYHQISALLPPVKHFPSQQIDLSLQKTKPLNYPKSMTTLNNLSICDTVWVWKQPRLCSGHWSAQLLWERKFTTWWLTQLQVNSVVRLFPCFKNKKVHTSSQFVIIGLQLAHVWGWLWGGHVSPRDPWRHWWGGLVLPAEIETKLLLLRLLVTAPQHWPTAPHSFLEVAGLPYSINGLIHSGRVSAPKNVQIN